MSSIDEGPWTFSRDTYAIVGPERPHPQDGKLGLDPGVSFAPVRTHIAWVNKGAAEGNGPLLAKAQEMQATLIELAEGLEWLNHTGGQIHETWAVEMEEKISELLGEIENG